jgi:hypothetical protein
MRAKQSHRQTATPRVLPFPAFKFDTFLTLLPQQLCVKLKQSNGELCKIHLQNTCISKHSHKIAERLCTSQGFMPTVKSWIMFPEILVRNRTPYGHCHYRKCPWQTSLASNLSVQLDHRMGSYGPSGDVSHQKSGINTMNCVTEAQNYHIHGTESFLSN